ncbi:MAG: hypothetical protein WKF87_14940 [Chryseolinea sp.]
MSLKAFVKVGTLTNLADARYCAGMGVDMVGFMVIPGQPDHTKHALFQEIRGWVSGPLFVAEIYGLSDPGELENVLENYKPDYFELGLRETSFLENYSLPFILRLLPGETMPKLPTMPAWIITNEQRADSKIPVLVEADTAESVVSAMESSNKIGIAFKVEGNKLLGAGIHEVLGPLLELMEED